MFVCVCFFVFIHFFFLTGGPFCCRALGPNSTFVCVSDQMHFTSVGSGTEHCVSELTVDGGNE